MGALIHISQSNVKPGKMAAHCWFHRSISISSIFFDVTLVYEEDATGADAVSFALSKSYQRIPELKVVLRQRAYTPTSLISGPLI